METKNNIFRMIVCILPILGAMMGLMGCTNSKQEPIKAQDQQQLVNTVPITTTYSTLQFPEELSPNMRHAEVVEGNVALEVFYMLSDTGEREVYRIYYADANVGTHMGYLKTDAGEIPITYALSEYSDEDFSEEERALYYSMMDAFSVVMNSIYEDERFSETRSVAEVSSQEAKFQYWTVTLPDNVQYQETNEGDTYRVDFFGVVSDERVDLFSISVGNVEDGNKLGLITVDGQQVPVMIQTNNMDGYDNWPKEEQGIIYQMMESLNDNIQAIMSNPSFSEFETTQ